eukprot:TRINITY_DN1756_c0_g1_i2.p1 TRINITY_DN1756_c0_g1~~TRINITY_DN1756_c0_g1_i2.p1  ORF type:complete len:356 (+),score=36.43 TRINITY_DN1756_c0_g1_i2:68-1069(+)
MANDHLVYSLLGGGEPEALPKDLRMWELQLNELSVDQVFASGAFGQLYRGRYRGQELAVKILIAAGEHEATNSKCALPSFQELERQFMQEVSLLSRLSHPNIVRFVGGSRRPGNRPVWCVATVFCTGGCLRDYLTKRQRHMRDMKTIFSFALDVANGMEYLHRNNVIHRDLKSENLLVNEEESRKSIPTIQIADFGVARLQAQKTMTPETGTYRWMAPEVIMHHRYDNKADVYSFGIVLWEIVTCTIPFYGLNPLETAVAVAHHNQRPKIPESCPEGLALLMTQCWDRNPAARPTFTEIVERLKQVEHEWNTDIAARARLPNLPNILLRMLAR